LARHLELLNRRLIAVTLGPIRRLLVTMPPRHGKSELISRFLPAWFLGAFPERRVLLASYESDFAAGWGRKARDVLEEYGPYIFGVHVRRSSFAAHRWEVVRVLTHEQRCAIATDHESAADRMASSSLGGMTTAGVGGPITGKGADLLIIDDPIKNAEQANSRTWREKTWEWYQSVAYTRLEPAGRIVLIQTRWHMDDLAGKLLAEAVRGGDAWEVINLPALAEANDPLERVPGEPLWPERFGRDRLREIRRTLGEYWWTAMYQQRPVPREGAIFKKGWFRYWYRDRDVLMLGMGKRLRLNAGDLRRDDDNGNSVPTGGDDLIGHTDAYSAFGIVDLAVSQKAAADYTVITAWLLGPGGELILLDCLRDRLEGHEIVPAIMSMGHRHRLDYVGIEKAGFQELIIQQARRCGLAVRPLVSRSDKVGRAHAAGVRFEAGLVYFPRDAIWLTELENELVTFPHGEHDDQVDCVTYACLEAARRSG
jgi:predicted phage terminase large subunit-like protein